MSTETLQLPSVGDIVGVGRFELLRQLGEGGTSTVFVAADRLLGREVALKLLIPRYVGRPEREQRLINEAEYLRRVNGHVNIVELIDSGRLHDRNDWPWLSTEVLAGEDLGWMFTRGKVKTPQVLNIARQTAVALARCHEAGVVHRDVTPSNLFLLEDNHTIKLFDFSHAGDLYAPKVPRGAPERLTGIFDTMGTAGYMGPEQAMNAPPDVSMDAFSFGIVLFQLVTGKDPYRQFTDRGAFIKAQREGTLDPVRLHAWVYDAPQELADLVHDCTQRDGTKRPTMPEIVERLDKLATQAESTEEVTAHVATKVEATEEMTAHVDAVALHSAGPAEPEPEGTAPVDPPALHEPRRPLRRSAPEVIGDWTVARRQEPTWSPALAVPLAVPVVASVAAPVVPPGPVVPPPVVALAPTAPPIEEQTVELAFARPPQLREAAAANSTVAVGEPSFALPPELRPLESRGSGDPDPGSANTEAEHAKEVPPPIGSSRARVVGLVAGLGLLVTALSWAAYSKFQEKPDGDRDRSTASPHDPNAAAESDGAPAATETGADDSDAVDETGGMEIVPEVEPVEPPKPENGKPENGKPENGKPENGKPEHGKPEHGKPEKDPACDGVEAEARAADNRDWNKVAKLTARKACWSSQSERIRLRVNALLTLGRVEECMEVGAGSSDAKVQSIVRLCEAVANKHKAKSP